MHMLNSKYTEYKFGFSIDKDTKRYTCKVYNATDEIPLRVYLESMRDKRGNKLQPRERVYRFLDEINPYFNKWIQRKTGKPCKFKRIKNQIPELFNAICKLDQYWGEPVNFIEIENMTNPEIFAKYLKARKNTRYVDSDEMYNVVLRIEKL